MENMEWLSTKIYIYTHIFKKQKKKNNNNKNQTYITTEVIAEEIIEHAKGNDNR